MVVVRSSSPERTRAVGRAIGGAARAGDVMTLAGPFGAGKTTLVSGIADGLGARVWLGSPSFAIVNEYPSSANGAHVSLFHLDLYRVAADGIEQIGLDDYLARRGVVVVEWPEAALAALPEDRLDIQLDYDDDVRRLVLSPRGERATKLAEAAALVAGDPGTG